MCGLREDSDIFQHNYQDQDSFERSDFFMNHNADIWATAKRERAML